MHRLRIVVLALMAVFSLAAAVMAASASAEVVLPLFTVETPASVTAGPGEFTSAGGTSIKCTELGAGKLSPESSKRLGSYTFDFLKCTASVLGIALGCKSLGDGYKNAVKPNEGGTILNTGTWHLVRGNHGSPIALILLLIKETHLECSNEKLTITALILVRGTVCGTITPLNTKTKTFKVVIKTTKAGGTEQEVKEYENDAGTLVVCKLESSTNGGAFEAAGENSEPATMVTEKETEIVES